MVAPERTDEIEIEPLLWLASSDESDPLEGLKMSDVADLNRKLDDLSKTCSEMARDLAKLQATAVNTAEVTGLKVELAGVKGQLKIVGLVLGAVGVAALGLALAALFPAHERARSAPAAISEPR